MIANPPQTITVVNFWLLIPKNTNMPPTRPKRIESVPNITSSTSTPKVKGVNTPDNNNAAAIM